MKDVFSDVYEVPENLNIQPYMFEPPVQINNDHIAQESSEESDDEVRGNDQIDRRANTIWCECGSCKVMETTMECTCCAEIPLVDQIRESSELECITEHESFRDNCLNVRVLEVSLHEYIQREGPLYDNEPINEVYRHIAYGGFVLWIWHRLERGNRKVLPAIVVTAIWRTFPSENYTGFQESHLAS